MKSLNERFVIRSYETDFQMNLKPFSFMNFAQDLAQKHADALKFGYNDLITNNTTWVLSRVHIKFLKYPKWNESVIMETWHKGNDKLFGIRDYEMLDQKGNQLILATSMWLIIDTKTRKIQRADKILGIDNSGYNSKNAIDNNAERLSSPNGLEILSTKKVSFADIDLVGHTNNAKYIEWAMDCIDFETLKHSQISDITINFNAESKIYENIDMYSKIEDGVIFIEGKREGTSIFQSRFILKKEL